MLDGIRKKLQTIDLLLFYTVRLGNVKLGKAACLYDHGCLLTRSVFEITMTQLSLMIEKEKYIEILREIIGKRIWLKQKVCLLHLTHLWLVRQ